MKRVVITGMGIVSPVGNSPASVTLALTTGRSGVRGMEAWGEVGGLRTGVAGVVSGIDPKRISRKYRRTMGRVSLLAALAAKDAISDAGLLPEMLDSDRTGVSMGSTMGSAAVLEEMFRNYFDAGGVGAQEGTTFMKVMSHTAAANVAAMTGTRGRLIAPCSACASSTQAIGFGAEAIRAGRQDIMLCGGAEDLHPTTAGVFDILGAASRAYNMIPEKTPRPFDDKRDGMVVGEGGGVVILEAYDHAVKRGARIYGEVAGFGTCSDGRHMTSPSEDGMRRCMIEAATDAGVTPGEIDYINAHATGTLQGDAVEARAIAAFAGDRVPVSGTKGYTGHTLAASGVMEVIFCLMMMEKGFIAPTLNLENEDPECAGICHVKTLMEKELRTVMSCNFAFGGVNAALVLKQAL